MHISTGHNNWLAWIDAAPWKYYSFDIYWILCHLLIWLTFVYLIDFLDSCDWHSFIHLIDIYQFIWLMFLDSCDWHSFILWLTFIRLFDWCFWFMWLTLIDMTWHLYIYSMHMKEFFSKFCASNCSYIFLLVPNYFLIFLLQLWFLI